MNKQIVNNTMQVAQAIEAAQNIVLTTHLHHDGDGIGSMLALYHVLIAKHKTVRMILNEPLSEQFGFLEAYVAIENCHGQTIDCDLLIVLDTDCSDIDRCGIKGTKLNYGQLCCIDHHASNRCVTSLCIVDTTVAATGELLYDLFGIASIPVNKVIAECLFVAISTDCGSFRYANTTAKTLRIAAALLDKGVRPETSSEAIGAKSFVNTIILSKILNTLEKFDGNIVSLTINNELLKTLDDDSDNYVDYARKVIGCEAAVLFKEVEPRLIKLSLRFKYKDASQFAQRYGGGGHPRAAGFSIAGELSEIKTKIIKKLKDYLQQADG
ncbi:MAG: DHH family phosphoesterase [Negativicutes bacterium]|jgi:phosphoesterase RecJ-like protein